MYKAIFFHPAGDYATDFHRATVEEVWAEIEDMGSRWIFYPIPVVVHTDEHNTIADMPEHMEHWKDEPLVNFQDYLKKEWDDRSDDICKLINDGCPLYLIY